MRRKNFSISKSVVFFIILAITVNGLSIPIYAQEKSVVISIGQPSIWSLEQAHYLLARMHRQSLDLQTVPLGNLDPNETNAQRVSIIRQLLSAGFKFDEAVGLNNELLKSDKTFNSQRRQDLIERRSVLQAERTQVSREITALKIAKSKTSDEAEKAALDAQIEAKTEEKAGIEDELANVNDELSELSSATGDFQSVGTTDQGFDPTKLPSSSKLEGLISNTAVKPSIAASQRLENHIGIQYEIIAKQLTLLRDEVGPGERLVFLELPQSINLSQDQEKNKYYQALRGIAGMSTNDSADNKMAQVWWRIAGYTRVDQEELFQKELSDLETKIEKTRSEIEVFRIDSESQKKMVKTLDSKLKELCAQKEQLEGQLKKAEEKKNDEECSKIAANLDLLKNTIKEIEQALESINSQDVKIAKEQAKLVQSLSALYTKHNRLKFKVEQDKLKNQQETANRLWQGGGQNTDDLVRKTVDLLSTKSGSFLKADDGNNKTNDQDKDSEGREYISLSGDYKTQLKGKDARIGLLRNRAVRVIDVIPRQNAINVDNTKVSVKATGVVAAFSFLFGFGGNVRYQRQSEQFEDFLNQELYTSGFGKGQTDFGWSFFPFAGTKQMAPGIRTTYAVAIIPEDAETIVLNAQGCYFPRREKQPLDYDSTFDWKNGEHSSCSEREQVFVIPVPGGSGRGSDFYITELRYSAHRKNGERMVAAINGQNISPQIGVMVEGVPLTQAVGLAQSNIESVLGNKVDEKCENQICGRFERVSSNQIIISFKMPDGFKGTPRITLIAPGKAIEINNLNLSVNGADDVKLDDLNDMFGQKLAEAARSVNDFKAAPDPNSSTSPADLLGVVTGKFEVGDSFYVNGSPATIVDGTCKTANLCIIGFPAQKTDFLTVTLVPSDKSKEAVSKTFVNPSRLKIINSSVVAFKKAKDSNPAVLTVKIDGAGFSNAIVPAINAPGSIERLLIASSGQMILEIRSPAPIVQITLTDGNTNNSVSTTVKTPEE